MGATPTVRRFSTLLGVLALLLASASYSFVAAERPRHAISGRYYTMADFNRWAKLRAPKRLTQAQLDPDGIIAWPRELLRSEYSGLRRDLDRLFRNRAELGGAMDDEDHDDVFDTIGQMRELLIAKVSYAKRPHQTRAYLNARNFLESLAYEMKYATNDADNPVQVGLADN